MSEKYLESPVILDSTGVRIAEAIEGIAGDKSCETTGEKLVKAIDSVAAALWKEKSIEPPLKDVNFYDYDGTVVYSFTKAEFLGLSAMPANPAHTGLRAQGWNWTIEAAQDYVEKYGTCEIGQMYITDDGKTRLYIRIGRSEAYAVHLKFNQSAANGVTVNWGDGSAAETAEAAGNVEMTHTYAADGDYIITMAVAEGCSVRLGTNTQASTTLANAGGSANCFFRQGIRTTGGVTGRDALLALEIGAGVTDIGSGAFNFSTNIRTITIPQEVDHIRSLSFVGCIMLQAVVVPAGVTEIGDIAFGWCQHATAICLPGGLTAMKTGALRQCLAVKRISVPEGVTALPAYVLSALNAAEVISIPDTIAGAVGLYAFDHCYSVETLNIPVGVTSIGNYAFKCCYNLKHIELPEGVTTIGQGAFSSCFGFEDFIIPSTVTKIDKFAFLYNDGMNTFHVRATTPPTLEATAFTETISGLTIYVPYSEDHSILNAYLEATGWSGRGDQIREEEP